MAEPQTFDEFEATLEIPRELVAPKLSEEVAAKITRLTFRPSEPQHADLFFLFGTHQCDWKRIVGMYEEGLFPKIMLTGRVGPSWYERGVPLSHHMLQHLRRCGMPEEAILIEDESMNTLEDVLKALPVLRASMLAPESILFGAKAHHSGRCYLTLKRFFPSAELHAFTWPAAYGSVVVDADTWTQDPVSASRVYGEYRRILTYSARGDIAMPD